MPRLFVLVITTLFFFSLSMETNGQIKEGQVLSLQQSVNVAVQNHPSIKAARSTVYINQSRVGQARANYFTQVNFTSSYDRLNPATGPGGNIVGRGPTMIIAIHSPQTRTYTISAGHHPRSVSSNTTPSLPDRTFRM